MPADFYWTLRVYYEDTDANDIIFYANYLKFFERARTEWLRAAGVSQQNFTETHGRMFVVKCTAVDYHAPAKLDDELKVSVVVEKLGRASVQFFQEAWRVGPDGALTLLSSGRIKVGCVNTSSMRPDLIPADVMTAIDGIRNSKSNEYHQSN